MGETLFLLATTKFKVKESNILLLINRLHGSWMSRWMDFMLFLMRF